MTSQPMFDALTDALEGRALLTHPFYQRWEAGELAAGELAAYAVNYRLFEEALPVVLAAVVDRLVEAGHQTAADEVAKNLADETGRPEPHLALFDRFARALEGPDPGTAGPAAAALVGTYLALADEGALSALAGLAAYETQASAVAATKADGLRRWYGLDDEAVAFWDVHAAMDADHGQWAVDALCLLGADPDDVGRAARRAADAWWSFLDEREAAAPVPA